MPQERNKNNQKIAAKTTSNVVHKLYFFLVFLVYFFLVLLVFFALACMDEKSTTLKCPSPKQRPTQIRKEPKMAQDEPNMVPTWPKMSQHSPKWSKTSPIWYPPMCLAPMRLMRHIKRSSYHVVHVNSRLRKIDHVLWSKKTCKTSPFYTGFFWCLSWTPSPSRFSTKWFLEI